MERKTTGTEDKLKGKANELLGRVRGDKSQEAKGRFQQTVGEAKNAVDDIKKELKGER